ncbi:MAG: glycerophosphoryl diester phosphodiesterase [Cyclobacteriaceae bacterium]|jgi:glycerophosphoryl diester phosphodiesterase
MARLICFGFLLFTFIHLTAYGQDKVDELTSILKDRDTDYVMVVAHRGDWRNAPENSLQAIQNCIDMGVDIIEIDVRMTKDSVFVLMHDNEIDRTTNGTGRVENLTWEYLSGLRLKDGIGAVTSQKIPRLEEVVALTKGKILLNLDKAFDQPNLIAKFLNQHSFWRQVVLKGWMIEYEMLSKYSSFKIDSAFFMPIVSLEESNWESVINSYKGIYRPVAFEILFNVEGRHDQAIYMIKNMGSKVWINSLWPEFNAGHDDERAVKDPEGSYGWLANIGAQIIQTDRPALLIDYLESSGLRQLNPK